MNGEQLKSAMRAGNRLYGTMLVTARTGRWDHTIGVVGFDFIVVDNAHAPYSRAETADWMAKLSEMDIVPFIRIADSQPYYAQMALDAGAHGVVAPYMETVAQVQEMVGAVKYRPLQGDMLQRVVREGWFPSEETRKYLEHLNRNTILAISLDSVAGLDRVDELVAVQGVDLVLVASHNLSIQLGIPNRYDHPDFTAAVKRIAAACQAAGVPLMVHLFNHDMAVHWLKAGLQVVLFGTDRRALSEGFIADFEFLRNVDQVPARAKLRLVHREDQSPDR
ncbi:MAG: aldolase/citrate lyase family protein [Deltaproteobacteria bacterium]|nr:aldolase/citrate lyase family protein [Deltaproteobacteria bacterium]